MTKHITLPSVLTESAWFYKDNEELCKPHIGKYYISYSSVNAWENPQYRPEFIRSKFAGIKHPTGIYAKFGSWCGFALEWGQFPIENPDKFSGEKNIKLDKVRPENAVYEKMILIDRGTYIIVGFIDMCHEYEPSTLHVRDQKTGGKGKHVEYESESYIQVILYAHALEQQGYKIGKTDVYFIRRTGSHVSPPLTISEEQFIIPIKYNKDRVEYALNKVDRVVGEISDLYKIYLKYFK